MRQVPSQTSAIEIPLSKQFASASAVADRASDGISLGGTWKTPLGNTVSASAKLRQGKMRSTNSSVPRS